MKKLSLLLLTVVLSALLAGVYGILHDQLTYSISHEYFTKFKYAQFGFESAWFGGDRPTVVVIGFLATWWVGACIGTGLGLLGLLFSSVAAMRSALGRAIGLVYCTAIVAGGAGFLYGKYYLVDAGVDWWLPADLLDKNAFITVGSMHNFSYAGGLLGLLIGALYLLKARYYSPLRTA
jgi:hypothetical protein